MLNDHDIDAAAQGILNAGRLVETGALEPGSPVFDAADSNALVLGDVHEGCTVRGNQALVVQGTLLGTEVRPCTVQAGLDVVIRADAQYAQITGRTIRIGGEARHCRLHAVDGIEVGVDLSDSHLVVGIYEERKRLIETLQHRALQVGEERRLFEQRLRAEEKRIYKVLKSTRFTCDDSLTQIIRPRSDRIQINLRPFYQAVGQRPDDELDQALLQFYARAVIGRLTEENKVHLQNNPSRQTAFTRVLEEFRRVFVLTRRLDAYATQVDECAARINEAIGSLLQQSPRIHVHGALVPALEMDIMMPEVERAKDGMVTFVPHAARLVLTPPAEGGGAQLKQVDRDGAESARTVAADELNGVSIRVDDGSIAWSAVGTDAEPSDSVLAGAALG